AAAVAMACHERRTVVLNLPLVVLDAEVGEAPLPGPGVPPPARAVAQGDLERLTSAVRAARRPVFVAGRGARSGPARDALVALADTCGALLATSAVAKGLFHDQPWSLDVSGGFSSPLAAELIAGADLVVGWGCALNMWTMRHGRLIGEGATVVQVDDTPEALGLHRELSFGVVGDVAATARGVERLLGSHRSEGYRSEALRERLDTGLRWRDVPYTDTSDGERIDPRTLTSALDDLLPRDRVVAVDSGNFMGYPAMYLEVP